MYHYYHYSSIYIITIIIVITKITTITILTDTSALTEPGSNDSPLRSAKGTRIPKINSRASFVRTPGRVASAHQEDDGMDGREEGVLITELQVS